MATTINDISNRAMAIADEYTKNNAITPLSDLQDYRLKIPHLLKQCVNENVEIAKFFQTHTFTVKRFKNILNTDYTEYEFTGIDKIFQFSGGKSYYFEVNDECSVFIEEHIGGGWVALETHQLPENNNGYTVFKGIINRSTTGDVRIRFSGRYYYRFKNVCVYDEEFRVDKIPPYAKYYPIELPDEVIEVEGIINISNNNYASESLYRLEKQRILHCDPSFEGTYRINYKALPLLPTETIIDQEVAFETVFNVDDQFLNAAVYFIVGILFADENEQIAGWSLGKYDEERARLKSEGIEFSSQIDDSMGLLNGLCGNYYTGGAI